MAKCGRPFSPKLLARECLSFGGVGNMGPQQLDCLGSVRCKRFFHSGQTTTASFWSQTGFCSSSGERGTDRASSFIISWAVTNRKDCARLLADAITASSTPILISEELRFSRIAWRCLVTLDVSDCPLGRGQPSSGVRGMIVGFAIFSYQE